MSVICHASVKVKSALVAFVLILSVVAPRAFAQGGEPQTFAIRGATVVPVSGPRLENATVVISKGVIAAVGKNVSIPKNAWIIEGSGLTVYPGLFDAFTDVGITSAGDGADKASHQSPPYSNGPEDRPASTPWRSAAVEATLSDKRIEKWREAGFTTVLSSPKNGLFPGQGVVLDLAGTHNGDMVVKPTAAIPTSLQPPGGGFPVSLMGTISYVSQVWLDTDWSAKADAIYDKNPSGIARPRYDNTDDTLAAALGAHAVVLVPANNSTQIRRALRLIDRWRVNGVLYGAQMAYETADEIAAAKVPVLVDLKWPEAEKDADPDDVPSLRTLRFRDGAPSSPAALAKSGAKFAFYSGEITAPQDILKAVKKSVDAGLSPDAALRALTLTPAEIFGVADRLGSIETGKIANLVITNGDLFSEKTKIKTVFADGQRFEIHESEMPKDHPKPDAADEKAQKPQGETDEQ